MKTQYDLPGHLAAAALREADSDLREKHESGVFDDGDPNHPMYNNSYNYATGKYILLGMDQDEFMAKQYR